MLDRLSQIGIYGWAHLVQVIVLAIGWGWAIGWIIPACIRDTRDMWEALNEEEASLMETAEATEKTTTTSSLSRKA